jgi:O-methyltransferase
VLVANLRAIAKRSLPKPLLRLARLGLFGIYSLQNAKDRKAVLAFIWNDRLKATFGQRVRLAANLYKISFNVQSPHTQEEILHFIEAILSLPREMPGVVVETGCFKGGSSSKFSLAAEIAGRELLVFDSFEGIPPNEEAHTKDIFGQNTGFGAGDYKGALEEVKGNVTKYGAVQRCRFIKGWFDDTLPLFKEPVAAVYVDVDLVSSTSTCLKYLYPLLQPGGTLCSQDGHLPLVLDLFNDAEFWRKEVGCEKPEILGFGKSKLIKIIKPKGGVAKEKAGNPG